MSSNVYIFSQILYQLVDLLVVQFAFFKFHINSTCYLFFMLTTCYSSCLDEILTHSVYFAQNGLLFMFNSNILQSSIVQWSYLLMKIYNTIIVRDLTRYQTFKNN